MELEFVRNIYLNTESAKKASEQAQKHNISLSCHAPYYINLASTKPGISFKSKNLIQHTLDIAEACKATIIVIHAGYYMEQSPEQTYNIIKSALQEFTSTVKLGIETMGRQKQFGTVEEIARLTEECENVAPVIDFAHIHARTDGGIKTKDDFKKILDTFDNLNINHIHCHMTGIKYENGNEKRHIPISSNEPDFRHLATLINENNYNMTIISESPLIEQDALLFKSWLK